MPQQTDSALRTLLPSGFKSLLLVTPLCWQHGEMPMGLHFAIRGPKFKTLTLLISSGGTAANHFPSISFCFFICNGRGTTPRANVRTKRDKPKHRASPGLCSPNLSSIVIIDREREG